MAGTADSPTRSTARVPDALADGAPSPAIPPDSAGPAGLPGTAGPAAGPAE
jgi:hypothetical protein